MVGGSLSRKPFGELAPEQYENKGPVNARFDNETEQLRLVRSDYSESRANTEHCRGLGGAFAVAMI
jgi:hypothetical protein